MNRSVRWLFAASLVSLLGAVSLAACGGDDDDDDGSPTSAIPGLTGTITVPGVTGQSTTGAKGTGSITADGVTTEVAVDECTPGGGGGPVVVVASNTDADATFSAIGIGGAATVEFKREGTQWLVVGAVLEVDGDTLKYDGPALKTDATPPDSELKFEINCS